MEEITISLSLAELKLIKMLLHRHLLDIPIDSLEPSARVGIKITTAIEGLTSATSK